MSKTRTGPTAIAYEINMSGGHKSTRVGKDANLLNVHLIARNNIPSWKVC